MVQQVAQQICTTPKLRKTLLQVGKTSSDCLSLVIFLYVNMQRHPFLGEYDVNKVTAKAQSPIPAPQIKSSHTNPLQEGPSE